MTNSAAKPTAAASVASVITPRSVAVIDDGFIPITLDRVVDAEVAEILKVLAASSTELAAAGFADPADTTTIFEGLMDQQAALTDLYIQLIGKSPELERMLGERHALKQLVKLIEEQIKSVVIQCRPDEDLPDLTTCDLVLIDFYLEGGNRESELSKTLASAVHAQNTAGSDQQIVLMSSLESIRDSRAKFRAEASLPGAAFAFIGKADMDERWKVKAHLGMLDRARPHAPVLSRYRDALDKSLEDAKANLLRLADDLDIGDYAYLQSQALMSEGHPLGDYVSWLLASHLTTLAFEKPPMREKQGDVDRLEFESKAFAATEPSPVVAQLFHSALLSSNLGPLGAHPRAKAGGGYEQIPMVQLGDVFMDAACTKAVVVMSADCDLAFSPMVDRAPSHDTPVLLLPGTPKAFDQKGADKAPSTAGVLVGDRVYRIDWSFSGYRSTTLGKLAAWLADGGFDTSNRSRLRPLYGLKLQQEFGAHLLRVGPPVMPPLTYAAEGRLYRCAGGAKELVQEFTNGEVMLSHHKDETVLRLTPKLVDRIRSIALGLRSDLQTELDAAPAGDNKKRGPITAKLDALTRDIDDDQLWIDLVDGMPLHAGGSMKDLKSVCAFVRGKDWTPPTKPRVVFEIVDKSSEISLVLEQATS